MPNLKNDEARLVHEENSSVNYYVKPIPKSRTKVNGTIVRNIDSEKVILITISEKKPKVADFFPKKTRIQPCTVIEYLREFDATNVKLPVWSMLAQKINKEEVSG